jgi:hypothetical protein
MKEWLTKNKIYFELLSSVLFGAAALLVAYASYNVSSLQLEVAEQTLEPHFYIEESVLFNPATKYYEKSELYIFNAGSPVGNLSFQVMSFLIVDREVNSQNQTVYIPVNGYYFASFNHQTPVGKLVTYRGHLNNKHYGELHAKLLDGKTKKKYGFINLNLKHLVKVSFRDHNKKEQQIYFEDKKIVPKEKINSLLKIHKKIFAIDIENLTVDALMKRATEVANND